jgi:hypothetical protein
MLLRQPHTRWCAPIPYCSEIRSTELPSDSEGCHPLPAPQVLPVRQLRHPGTSTISAPMDTSGDRLPASRARAARKPAHVAPAAILSTAVGALGGNGRIPREAPTQAPTVAAQRVGSMPLTPDHATAAGRSRARRSAIRTLRRRLPRRRAARTRQGPPLGPLNALGAPARLPSWVSARPGRTDSPGSARTRCRLPGHTVRHRSTLRPDRPLPARCPRACSRTRARARRPC